MVTFPLSPAQARFWRTLRVVEDAFGEAPTVRDVAKITNISTHNAHRFAERCARQGMLRYSDGTLSTLEGPYRHIIEDIVMRSGISFEEMRTPGHSLRVGRWRRILARRLHNQGCSSVCLARLFRRANTTIVEWLRPELAARRSKERIARREAHH